MPVRDYFTTNHLVICAVKGIENNTGKMPRGIIADVLGDDIANKAVFLSGPSFAAEVVVHQPTAVTVASHTKSRAVDAQAVFHAPHFRTYIGDDPIGVEVAGALKNVMAIASGAASGLGFQMNARAGFVTRALAEMTRVGVALGADPITFAGLSGVGDLFLTCSSEKSRNFKVGFRLGQGEEIQHILDTLGSVAEGYYTTKSAYELAQSLEGVDTPIIDQVYSVLYGGVPLKESLYVLMNREMKDEFSLPTTAAAPSKAGTE